MGQARILLLLAALAARSHAQSRIVDNNPNAWFMYFGDHGLGKSKWGVHLEGQWRRTNLGTQWQQLLLRPGVNYQLTPKVMLTGGYCFVETHRYGDYPVRAAFPEHRFFEQAQVTQRKWKVDWINRFRLEQREFGQVAPLPRWRYENRFRYMFRANVPLPWRDGAYYLGLYDEILVAFGHNVAANTFDQNRAYAALGRKLPKQTRLEIGFMEQTLQHRDGRVWEHNHTLQVAIYSRLPFGAR